METLALDCVRSLASDFVTDLTSEGIGPHAAFLFGSYANGNPHPYSDIDLAFIVGDDYDISRKGTNEFYRVLAKKKYIGISPALYSITTFLKGGLFLREILPKAIQIPVPGQPFPIELPAVYLAASATQSAQQLVSEKASE